MRWLERNVSTIRLALIRRQSGDNSAPSHAAATAEPLYSFPLRCRARAVRAIRLANATATFASGMIILFEAPVRPITIGDGFLVTAGCDKQVATCTATFGNGLYFRGFPHMPGEDAVMRYPNQGDANTGNSVT